ncbi:MAG: hypothetical protein ACJ79A_13705 [Gemmatimonadaceae bacterium]
MKAFSYAALALFVASPLLAQVGHDPASSPYRDLEYRQELTPYGGYARAKVDPAGITPQSAAIAGLRYELYLGGPVSLTSDFSTMFSDRTVLDPTKPRAQRVLGTETAPVYALDLGMALGMTGRKSWHSLVPQVRAGLGVVTSKAADDTTGYKFGTPFAITFGAGLKFVTGGRLQLRADVGERLFKQKYPEAYYRTASDNTAVLTDTPRSFWTNHGLFTVGVSFLFDR